MLVVRIEPICVFCPSRSVHQSEEHRLGGYDHSCKKASRRHLKKRSKSSHIRVLYTIQSDILYQSSIHVFACACSAFAGVEGKQESIYPILICSSGPASATHPSGTALISTGSLCDHGVQF
jgi:hypothetical protein